MGLTTQIRSFKNNNSNTYSGPFVRILFQSFKPVINEQNYNLRISEGYIITVFSPVKRSPSRNKNNRFYTLGKISIIQSLIG